MMSTESRYSPVSYVRYYYGALYSVFVSILTLIGWNLEIEFFKISLNFSSLLSSYWTRGAN